MVESPISMREFFRKAKEKGDIDLQKFAVLYLNAEERMLNHIQMAAYNIMHDPEYQRMVRR
jgi:ribosomal protein L19E